MLFRRRRDPQPSPPWLKWLVGIFLVFAVIANMQKGSPSREALNKAGEDLAPGKILPMESYNKATLLPDYTSLRINNTAPGDGIPAVCGQHVKLAYQSFASDDAPLPEKADKDAPLEIHIGEGKLPGLEQGVVGMQKGGKRSLTWHEKDKPTVRYEVEPLEIAPPLPELGPYRIFVTQIGGGGDAFLCGKEVKVQITLWNSEGKKIFPPEGSQPAPVTFTPGKSEVFLGLEQGVIGMQPGGMRTLIVPPAFQNTMDGTPPKVDFPLPKSQTVLVDVEALP